jgi:Bacteriophage head to tail connecting protein
MPSAFAPTLNNRPKRPTNERNIEMVNLMEQIRARHILDRAPYEPVWTDIQYLLDPHLVIWDMMSAGFPDFNLDLFITSRHLQSFDDLDSGLQEGITPASQLWSMFGLMDEEDPLNDDPDVWNYLHLVTKRYQSTLINSNFYQQVPILYRSVSRFATGAMMMERDLKNFVRFTTFPIGSYYISNNNEGVADSFCRMYRMKVRQIVEEFCKDEEGKVTEESLSNLTEATLTMWNNQARREEWVSIVLMIWPNPEYDPNKARYDSKFDRYAIKYYEYGRNDGGKILREEGMPFFPVYCPRWYRQPTDAYGVDSPGFKARAPIRRMFKSIEMWLQSMSKVLEPPMVADPAVGGATGGGIGTTPNYLTIAPGGAGQGKTFGPAYQIQPDLKAGQEFIEACALEIDRICKADIFRRFGNDQRETPPTATEVLERVKEDSRVLGPMFGSFNFEWLQRMGRDMYWMFLEDKVIPPAPAKMHGANLKIEIISRIAIALKQGDVQSINAFVQFVTMVAQAKAIQGTEMLNADEIIDYALKIFNLPPKFVYGGQALAKIRQNIARINQQQQKMQQQQHVADTAKTLSQANTGGDTNMLQKLTQQ